MTRERERDSVDSSSLKTFVSSSPLTQHTLTHSLPPSGAAAVPLTGENVRRDEESGDVVLSWQQPSPAEARGYIFGYEIRFSEVNEDSSNGRRRRQECARDVCRLMADQSSGCCQVGPNTTSATISGLDQRKGYEVSVSVLNRAGTGEIQTFSVPPGELAENE